MNKLSYLIISLTLLAVACNKSEKETPNGFKYTMVKAGDGVVAKPEQLLVFDYVIKDSKDSVWADTQENGFPGVYQVKDTTGMKKELGMQQLFRLLSKGDSITVSRPTKIFFKDILGGPVPPKVDTTLSMSINLRVNQIMEKDSFQTFQQKLMALKVKKQKIKDEETISKYLAENNIKAQTDTSGMHFVIHNSTGGKKPQVENCVEVKYVGKFMKDGQVFDQNDRLAFPLTQVIKGWQIGIPMLGVGDSATFYVPSGLGYGPQGFYSIPPDAILIFNVQLLDFKNGFDQATRTCK